MTELHHTPTPASPLTKILGWSVGIIGLAGFIPILLLILGTPFLPSMEWSATAVWPASIFGMAVGAFSVVLILLSRASNPQLADASIAKVSFTCLAIALMMWMFAFLTVVMTYPIVQAWIGGDDTRLAFVVEDPVGSGSRGCRQAVALSDMPFLFDSLCGTPPEMQQALSKGQAVYALGNGTELGVFYDRFEW